MACYILFLSIDHQLQFPDRRKVGEGKRRMCRSDRWCWYSPTSGPLRMNCITHVPHVHSDRLMSFQNIRCSGQAESTTLISCSSSSSSSSKSECFNRCNLNIRWRDHLVHDGRGRGWSYTRRNREDFLIIVRRPFEDGEFTVGRLEGKESCGKDMMFTG